MSGVLLFLVFVISAALLIASIKAARSAGLRAAYERMASQFHGQVMQQGAFGWPAASIAHRDAAATVTVAGPWGMRATQVEIGEANLLEFVNDPSSPFAPSVNAAPRRPASRFTCEITPAGLLQRMAYVVGGRKSIAESPQFNLQYVIATDAPEQARRLLTRYVQVQIDRLRYFQGGNDIFVRFHNGTVTVSRRGVIRNERVLRQYVALALELYEQAAASSGVGIDFLASTGKPIAEAVCKVCGDPLDGDEIVYCRICDTPHHRDCWRYFGGCSVYACGERRFARAPRLARP